MLVLAGVKEGSRFVSARAAEAERPRSHGNFARAEYSMLHFQTQTDDGTGIYLIAEVKIINSKQKTLIGFFELLDKFNAEHKTQIGLLDLLDEISAEGWSEWAQKEGRNRKTIDQTTLPRRKIRKKKKVQVASQSDLTVRVPSEIEVIG